MLLSRACAVVAITHHSAVLLTDILRVPEHRITVIGNFRSAARFHPLKPEERRAVRERLALPASGPLVCYLGALAPEKRPDLALRVLEKLPFNVHLAIAGRGALEGEVRRQMASGGLTHRAYLLGAVDHPEDLLSASNVLLLTSDTEGVPGALFEAGLCVTPAVATDVGFVNEVVHDGITGRLLPAGDTTTLASATVDVLAERDRYGDAALAHCREHFEEGVAVGKWEEFLRRMLQHP